MSVQNITLKDTDGNELKGTILFGKDLPKDETVFTIIIPGDVE